MSLDCSHRHCKIIGSLPWSWLGVLRDDLTENWGKTSGGRGVLFYTSHIGMCRLKGRGFWAFLVWKRVQTLPIFVWNRVGFSRDLWELVNVFIVLMDRSTVKRMLIYQNALFLPGHAVSSMQAIWSCHNVVKEPICTLPWQSLALDQVKYLQIAVN